MAASREELESLIRAADAAGDGDAVNVLFAEMDKLSQPKPQSSIPPMGSYPIGVTPQMAGAALQMPMAMDNFMRSAGVTATPRDSDIVTAVPETALRMGTGLAGTAAGGIAGLGQGLWNSVVPKKYEGPQAAQRVRQVQEAMTYKPRGAGGQLLSATVSLPGQAWSAGTDYLGEKTTDLTGLPSLGAAIKTVGDVAPGVVAARLSGARLSSGKHTDKFVDTKNGVPTTDQLRKASTATYKAADEANVVIRPESTRSVIDMLQKIADKENLGKLPPKMKEASDLLKERADLNKPLSLSDADKVRQIINDAKKSADAADQRLAKIAQKQYDEYLDNLQPSDTFAGDSARGVALLKDARDLFRRRRGSEMIDSMERKAGLSGDAKYSQAGLEHALRTEFLKFARNDKKMQPLTGAQRAAIERVASPGKTANALRAIGKFDPIKGGMPAFMTSVLGGGGGALLAGPAGAVAGPALIGATANLANRISSRVTKSNVGKAREAIVGRGSTGGLLGQGSATKPLVAQRGLLGAPTSRSAAQLRQEISSLDQEVQRLAAMGPVSSTVRASVEVELARLRRELEYAEAQGERP